MVLTGGIISFTKNNYNIDNSFSFCNSVQSIGNADSIFMTSFDIENPFTNVPLQETITICLNYLFPTDQSSVISLSRKYFKTLLEHSVLNSLFIFNSKVYKQIEGLGMGLPLGPTFANIFMSFNEQQWLADCPNSFKPVLYDGT